MNGPHLSLDLARDVGELLEYHFMVNALLAGAIVAVPAALIGWMMVLRRETFAGHTLAMMAFPGASGATLAGLPAALGYFVFCGAGALAIAELPGQPRRSWRSQSAATGAVQALALAVGFLFLSLYGGVLGDLENVLFGNLLGISDAEVIVLGCVALAALVLLACIARPLLFASVDPEAAAARGLPLRALSLAFLLLLGLTVAAASQITGVMLVFALLVAPAASAQCIFTRPAASLAASVAIALVIVWLGLGVSYFSIYPAGCFIAAMSFAIYLSARVLALARQRRGRARARRAHDPSAGPQGDAPGSVSV